MKLYVKCARCQGDLEIDTETVKNADALGHDLELEHAPGQCPGENGVPAATTPRRRFRAVVMVVELPPVGSEQYEALGIDEDKLDEHLRWPEPTLAGVALEPVCGTGKTVEARNAAEAVNGDLTGWLNDVWPKMQENAAWADVPAPPLAATTAE